MKKIILLMTMAIGLSQTQVSGEGFEIIEAGERTLLLDTKTGSVWRYYFNDVENQGWQITGFNAGSDETNNLWRLSPYGETFKVPK